MMVGRRRQRHNTMARTMAKVAYWNAEVSSWKQTEWARMESIMADRLYYHQCSWVVFMSRHRKISGLNKIMSLWVNVPHLWETINWISGKCSYIVYHSSYAVHRTSYNIVKHAVTTVICRQCLQFTSHI